MPYLYTFTNAVSSEFYVGIGESLQRVWEEHTPYVDALRDAPETVVLVTEEKFLERRDAERAEAIAINVATAGTLTVLNTSQTFASALFVPALPYAEGDVHYADLKNTAVVVVSLNSMDLRPTIHGGRSQATLVDRAKQWWPIANTVRNGDVEVDYLIMVAKGNGRILGDWQLAPVEEWSPEEQTFTFKDDADNDARGLLGKTLRYGGVSVGVTGSYSLDQRTHQNPSKP